MDDDILVVIIIADNKVSDFSLWDNKLLLEELNDIAKIERIKLAWEDIKNG